MTVAVDKDRVDELKKKMVSTLGKSWVNNTKTQIMLFPPEDKRAWLIQRLTSHAEEGWLDKKQAKFIKEEIKSNSIEFNEILDECLG